MALSILIPTLNESAQLPKLLAALVPQLLPEDEVLVADGGSTDDTLAIARRFGARPLSVARGRGIQLGLAAQAATGDRLWFLHADTQVPPDVVAHLRAAPGPWGCFHVTLSSRDPRLWFTARAMGLRARWLGSCTGDMGIWMDRGFYDALGGFAPWQMFEDLDISDRARARSPCKVLPVVLQTSSRKWKQNGVTRTILQMWMLRAAYRLGGNPNHLSRWYHPKRNS